MNEFSLIDEFFKPFPVQRKGLVFGIGDDAACLNIPKDQELLISTDTLVSEVHFLSKWDPYDIAFKAAMINFSDMAAMGAEPCWLTLALTLPDLNQKWLQSFTRGLKDALVSYEVDLIGGDTTRGPLSITLTVLGLAPRGQSIRRNGAKAGDVIVVSGLLGAAALALKFLESTEISEADKNELMAKLVHPKPRTDLVEVLRSYASSAIDISDGLSADLNHICVASGVGALLDQEAIPLHPLLKKYLGEEAIDLALTGGDDYELCFTVPPQHLEPLMKKLKEKETVCFPIGVIEERHGLRMQLSDKQYQQLIPKGYSHF